MSFFSLSPGKNHYRDAHRGAGYYKRQGILGRLLDEVISNSGSGRYYDGREGDPYRNQPPYYGDPYQQQGRRPDFGYQGGAQQAPPPYAQQGQAPYAQQPQAGQAPYAQQGQAPYAQQPQAGQAPYQQPQGQAPGQAGTSAPATMQCNACGSPIPSGSKFCLNCGQKLSEALYCPGCGEKLPASAKFCLKCGSQITG